MVPQSQHGSPIHLIHRSILLCQGKHEHIQEFFSGRLQHLTSFVLPWEFVSISPLISISTSMMAVVFRIIQAAFLSVTSWVLWKLFRNYVLRKPLDNIPGPKPSSWLTGNISEFEHRKSGWSFTEDLESKWNNVVRMKGIFGEDMLYVFDPKAMHSILVKDAHMYEKQEWALTLTTVLFGKGLLSVAGGHHRQQRKMLNPLFSIAHMRAMTDIFFQISYKLRDALINETSQGRNEVDILNWFGRTALELIGQGGLGYSFDPLVKNIPNTLGDAIKCALPSIGGTLMYSDLIPVAYKLGSPSFQRRVVDMIPIKAVKEIVKNIDTMTNECQNIYNQKKAALLAGDDAMVHQVGEGKDIMSVLLKANMNADEKDRLPEDELVAQMTTLVFAAVDTTSGALTRILDLLAMHPDVQDKLRAEIKDAHENGELTYDKLVDLPYLDAICRETLRLYPPVPSISRGASEDMILPLSEPIVGVDGSLMHEIFVPKGTQLFIGILSSNRNKALWGEDALEWKPERWLLPSTKELSDARIPGVYSNLMTFSGGGRSCIGFKFSQLEMKVVLSVLANSFKFSLSKNRDKVVWNSAGVVFPSIGYETTRPSMPMHIELTD
ncbi:cytochrome P450 family protein [Abortiporus biennis]